MTAETTNEQSKLEEIERLLPCPSDVLPENVDDVLRDLGLVQAQLVAVQNALLGRRHREVVGNQASGDKLINVDEAAQRLSCSQDWLYRNASTLPFTVRIGRRLAFSAAGIDEYIHAQRGDRST